MIVELDDTSLVTSGPYERFLKLDGGETYHHILDTKTGFPVESDFTSVSIITQSSFLADALSTSVYALGGYEKGMDLINSLMAYKQYSSQMTRKWYSVKKLLMVNLDIPSPMKRIA